jgi:hypothetical protein
MKLFKLLRLLYSFIVRNGGIFMRKQVCFYKRSLRSQVISSNGINTFCF